MNSMSTVKLFHLERTARIKKYNTTQIKDSKFYVNLSGLQTRYIVVIAASLLNAVFYLMRINMSVTIVAISLDTGHHTNLAPRYDWNAAERSKVLSSFFWGYTSMQLPAVAAVKYLGPTNLVFVMAVLCSLFTVLFVPAAAMGWQGACVARALLGVSQAGLMASTHQLLAKWSPPAERGRMVVYAYSGQQVGTILALAGSGFISERIGWPWVYYISGTLGLLLASVWPWLSADSPEHHYLASSKERRFIQTSLTAPEDLKKFDREKLKIPWRAVATSVPFWSLLVAQCAMSWGFWTLLTGIPSFMSGVLEFHLSEDGFLSSLPYFAMWIVSLFLGWLFDYLLTTGSWTVGLSRKVGSSISLYGSAIALVCLCHINTDTDPINVVIILTITVGLNAGSLVGTSPNHLDLAPNFASPLMGITNQIACVTAIVAPLTIGSIVTDYESEDQWKAVFLLTACIYIVGNTLFVMFGSGKEQPWNNPDWSSKNSDCAADLACDISALSINEHIY